MSSLVDASINEIEKINSRKYRTACRVMSEFNLVLKDKFVLLMILLTKAILMTIQPTIKRITIVDATRRLSETDAGRNQEERVFKPSLTVSKVMR